MKLSAFVLLTSFVSVFVADKALCEEAEQIHSSGTGVEKSSQLLSKTKQVEPTRKIRRLSEIERPSTSAQMLLVQSPAPQTGPSVPASQGGRQGGEVVQVTFVKANPTKKGVEVILQTTRGQALQLDNRSVGNNFIVDIPNAQLRTPSGQAFIFRSQQPIAGITQITVVNKDTNSIRVTVQGKSGAPVVELYESPNEGLIFSVASAASSAQQQPQTQPTPEASQSESQTQPTQPSTSSDEPIELVVTGQQDGYRVPDASTATKTDTPLRDIPQSIQILPQEVLRDQQVTSQEEALKNVTGLSQIESSRLVTNYFSIRGFSANSLRNGLRDLLISNPGFEPAIIDRIEVLKGPASVLYGQGSLGGTINYVTKQPLSEPYYSLEGSAGSFNFYRGALDLSGPLDDRKTVLYRLNAAAQTSGGFIDFYDSRRYAIAPVIALQISNRTKLTLEGEYLDFFQLYDSGLPAAGTILPNPNGKIPRNRFTGETSDGNENFRTYRTGLNFEHRFDEDWQLRSAFRALFQSIDRDITFSTGLLADNRRLQRRFSIQDTQFDVYNFDTYIVGKFATGSIQHQLVFGFDLARQDRDADVAGGPAAPLDAFNPVYGQPRGAITARNLTRATTDTLGIYLQDQITLADNLKLLLGGRFDIASQKQDVTNLLRSTTTSSFNQDEVFSPRVGIVYQPIAPISLYASYSSSFNPVTGTTFNGSPFQPERGTQYEVGVKADLNNRLSATLALFDLTRSNVSTTDPDNVGFSIQTGEQHSQGIELNLTGEILPGWNIIAGYTYTDVKVTKDTNSQLVDNRVNNVPKNAFNLWTTYEIQAGALQGWGFGLGFFFVGERQGDLANTFELPSYFRTDATIFYKREQFRAAINFRNLFDIDYFEGALSSGRIYAGEPLTVQGTVSWEF